LQGNCGKIAMMANEGGMADKKLADFFFFACIQSISGNAIYFVGYCLSDANNFKSMKWRSLIFLLAGGVLIGLGIGFWHMKLQTRQELANDASENRPISSALSMTSCAIALAPHKVPSRAEYQTGPDPEATQNQDV
jgi:hypothetical protein